MFHGFRFITKSKNFPTDWCSTDPTVPSDGEKVVGYVIGYAIGYAIG